MMVTAVSQIKTSCIQVLLPFKNVCGTNGLLISCTISYGTSLVKLFSTTSCLQSYKKLLNLDGKMIKKDGTVERIKTENQSRIIVINSRNEKWSMKLYDAQQLADNKGLNLIQVKSFGKQETYRMVTDKELNAKHGDKLKQYVFKSNIADNDFETKMKKVTDTLKKLNKIQLSYKFYPTSKEEKTNFGEKVKDYIKRNSLPYELTQTSSQSRIENYIIKKIDEKERKKEDEVKTVTI